MKQLLKWPWYGRCKQSMCLPFVTKYHIHNYLYHDRIVIYDFDHYHYVHHMDMICPYLVIVDFHTQQSSGSQLSRPPSPRHRGPPATSPEEPKISFATAQRHLVYAKHSYCAEQKTFKFGDFLNSTSKKIWFFSFKNMCSFQKEKRVFSHQKDLDGFFGGLLCDQLLKLLANHHQTWILVSSVTAFVMFCVEKRAQKTGLPKFWSKKLPKNWLIKSGVRAMKVAFQLH